MEGNRVGATLVVALFLALMEGNRVGATLAVALFLALMEGNRVGATLAVALKSRGRPVSRPAAYSSLSSSTS